MAIYTLEKNYDLAVRYNFLPAFVDWFWQIFKADSANIPFAIISKVLEMTVAKIKKVVVHSEAAAIDPEILWPFVHLVQLACHLMSTDDETSSLHQLVKAAVRTRCRMKGGRRSTLLHLAVDPDVVNGEWFPEPPSRVFVESLLAAGADVDSMDADGNTPLHIATINWKKHQSQQDAWLEVINLLLEHDAHVDFANADGDRASDVLPSSVNVFNHGSLQCLAARTVRMHHLPYHGILPPLLADFVDKH